MRNILLAFFCLTITLAAAQDQSAGKAYSLKECVDIALEKNLRVKRSLYNVQGSNVSLWQSKMAFLPSVNLGGSYGQNYGRAINPVTNTFINRNNNTLNAQLTSQWTLFNGLRLQNSFRQSQRDLEASNEDLQKAKNDVIINVVTLYINAIFNKELLDNARYQLSSSQQQLDRIKKQVAAGSLPKANELNQEAQVATNEVTLVNQENALNLSILQLKQALQMPASESLDVVIPELEVEQMIIDQTSEEVYQTALVEMPEIKSALLKVESAQFALRAAKGNLYPRLTLSGAATSNYSSANREIPTITSVTAVPADPNTSLPIGYASYSGLTVPVYQIGYQPVYGEPEKYTQTEQMKDNLFKTLTLNLQIPIFNQWQSRGAVQRAAINSEIARIAETETQNTLRQSIETAYNDAVAASKTYSSSLKAVSAREEAYRMNQQRFELGAVSFVEYQISENDLFQSKSDLTRAKYNFIFKKKILDFYQGKKIEY
jgi:outer membrane protein